MEEARNTKSKLLTRRLLTNAPNDELDDNITIKLLI
jgi:hypothetical protein